LALRSGVQASSISDLERGATDPRLSTIVRLAGGLGVEPRALLEGVRPRAGH
jgi:transcriptional regulator with XRE-family HTH domain